MEIQQPKTKERTFQETKEGNKLLKEAQFLLSSKGTDKTSIASFILFYGLMFLFIASIAGGMMSEKIISSQFWFCTAIIAALGITRTLK